jgi:hypothetical protein
MHTQTMPEQTDLRAPLDPANWPMAPKESRFMPVYLGILAANDVAYRRAGWLHNAASGRLANQPDARIALTADKELWCPWYGHPKGETLVLSQLESSLALLSGPEDSDALSDVQVRIARRRLLVLSQVILLMSKLDITYRHEQMHLVLRFIMFLQGGL